jgi:uncharacterized protein YacL
MSKTILRAIFAVAFASTGFLLGSEVFAHLIALRVASQAWLVVLKVLAPTAGAVLGIFVVPLAQSIFELELGETEKALERLTPPQLAGGAIGLIAGLLVAWLVKSVLFEFITGAGRSASYIALLLFVLVGVFTAYLGARVGAKQRIGQLARSSDEGFSSTPKLLDTSVIVDGRIVEIAQSGFLEGPIVVPRFVLRELQTIADSADASKRVRGRYGLEMLAKLQELIAVDIDERDYEDAGVDAKLLRAAREMNAKLITNDYNLSRVAHVEGVRALSVNTLSDALKCVVLPGEELHVALLREGKEAGQAVGYLDDGTMIVVEQGRRFIGEEVDVSVATVLRTIAGRMIFAKIKQRAEIPS